jgi:dolichol-phosphate mannosyltransferase
VLEDHADLVVGSRRLPGGAVENWPWHRRLASRIAGLMTVGLSRMSDPTSGFMAARRSLLVGLDLDPVGWKVVLEVVVKSAPARVREIAITFADRERGASKLGLRAQYDFVRHLVRLHEHRRRAAVEFVKFCLVGALGVVVDVATVIAARELLALDHRLCAAAGFLVAVSHNYLLNRFWTFRHARETSPLDSYTGFVAVCSLGLLVRLGIVHALVEHTGLGLGRWYILANFVGIVAATAVNFTGAKFYAFASGSPKRSPGRGA